MMIHLVKILIPFETYIIFEHELKASYFLFFNTEFDKLILVYGIVHGQFGDF